MRSYPCTQISPRRDVLLRSLAQVRCPVHAIYGREDALYQGRMEALSLALQQVPDFKSLTWIEEAGHWVQFERAEAFDQAPLATLNAAQ